VADYKNKILELAEHLVRMDRGWALNKIFEIEPEGRKRGRPVLRWSENVRKDVWELSVKIWQQKVVDREEWSSVIKEDKAVRGL
jgi:hypothetical protein